MVRFAAATCCFLTVLLSLSGTLGAQTASATEASSTASLAGFWQGPLQVPGMRLRLVLEVKVDVEGEVSADLDSIDQGANNMPVRELQLEEGTVRFAVPSIGGSYEGKLSSDQQSIRGHWSQGGQRLTLNLERSEEAPDTARPQDPKEPFPYDAVEVNVPSPEAPGVTLAGTLTLPPGEGPFPGLVLVSGSGPQDRDETLLGHRPFLILADRLSRQGFAVLRYDDRGVAQSTGSFAAATMEDFADDALAALRFLAQHDKVDSQRVGILGHSEGGIVGPMVASVAPEEVAFLVLMAAPAVPGHELLLAQGTLLLERSGLPSNFVDWNRRVTEAIMETLRSELEGEPLRGQLRKVLEQALAQRTEPERGIVGLDSPEAVEQRVNLLASDWYRGFARHDPGPNLEKLRCPVLAITGSNDLQVPSEENLGVIRAALDKAGNKRGEIVEMPGLNHLLQSSTTGLPAEYGLIEETIAPAALERMVQWLVKTAEALAAERAQSPAD